MKWRKGNKEEVLEPHNILNDSNTFVKRKPVWGKFYISLDRRLVSLTVY